MNNKRVIGIPLGSQEIESFLRGDSQEINGWVIHIDNLDLNDPFGGDRYSRIIFIENPNTNVGHFTLLSDFGDYFEYFDSLAGDIPDKIMQLNSTIKYLQEPLQSESSNVCGKWCILRHLSLPTELDQFYEIFKKKMEPDEMVERILQLKLFE